jgi:hypothetical protein
MRAIRAVPWILSAALVLPAGLAAQSSDDASVSISVIGDGVTVTKTIDMDFGSHPAGGVISSVSAGAAAQWDVQLSTIGEYNYSFSLPASLTGPGGSVPITFTSAIVASEATGMGYLIDPHIGANVPYDGGGTVIVQMGQDYDGGGNGAVTVNLGAAQAGTYSGTVTLTVAVP